MTREAPVTTGRKGESQTGQVDYQRKVVLGRKKNDLSQFPWRIVLSTWHGLVAGGGADHQGARQAGNYFLLQKLQGGT